MSRASRKAFWAILVAAAFLRTWGAFEIETPQEDEGLHAGNAASLLAWGTHSHSNWAHPPLAGVLMAGTIAVLGNDAAGWRADNVALGTASVALVFLVAESLYPATAVPLIAATLLAVDPSHVYASRTSFTEVPNTFFFLLFLHLLVLYAEGGRRTLAWAGVAAGLTMATKGYFVLAIPVAAAWAFHRALRRGEARAPLAGDFALALVLLPAAVFLLSYGIWFGRGYGLDEFPRLQADALRSMQGFRIEEFGSREWLAAGGAPVDWFTRPILVGKAFPAPPGRVRYLLEVNNFPIRLLALPALLATLAMAAKTRRLADALPAALFASCAVLILAVDRPMFSYSATVLVPFAHLATARAAEWVAVGSGRARAVRGVLLAAVVGWGLYAFPLAAARTAPAALYAPLRPFIRIVGNGA